MLSFLGGVLFKQLPPQLLKVLAVGISEVFETHRIASLTFKAVCQHLCLLWLYCDVLRSMPKIETSNQLGLRNPSSNHVQRLGRRFPILLQPLCWETTCQAHTLKAKQVAIWWQQKATLIGSTYQIETEAEAFSRKLSTLPEI